mmetsp:Transcript_10459/g.24567  ORF Transcript_10459/g.24567 Transcript_10459/m.24567 type:complete len:183 (-) Transcript_10459:71-619(-)
MEGGPQSDLTAARRELDAAKENLRVEQNTHPPDAQRVAKAEVGVAKAEVGFAKAEWQRADAVEKERYWFLVEEASKLVEDARKVFDTANTAHRDALAAAKAAAASAAAPAGVSYPLAPCPYVPMKGWCEDSNQSPHTAVLHPVLTFGPLCVRVCVERERGMLFGVLVYVMLAAQAVGAYICM